MAMFSRRHTFWHSATARRLIGLVLLLSVCASFVPLPVGPAASPGEKDRSEPFPCQDRPCGCRSAQQCWKKCCCFTNEQKLAWAKKNRVKVPDVVLSQIAAKKKLALASSGLCQAPGSSEKVSCCEEHRPEEHDGEPAAKKESKKSVNYQIGILVQQCQGEGPYWSSLPWCIVPQSIELSISVILIQEAPVFTLTLPADVCFSPPVPPPRQA